MNPQEADGAFFGVMPAPHTLGAPPAAAARSNGSGSINAAAAGKTGDRGVEMFAAPRGGGI